MKTSFLEKPHYCPVHKKCWHTWAECTRNSVNGGDITMDETKHQQFQNNQPTGGGAPAQGSSQTSNPQFQGNGQGRRKWR